MVDSIEVATINPDNIYDRLGLCWGHLPEWRDLKIVKESKKWLEGVSAVFRPTTFIAYLNGLPTGMIESVPHRLLMEVGLCPCRIDKEKGETERRYVLGEVFSDYMFVSCLMVSKEQQGRGVGRALLHHFLKSQVFNDSDGALVYVTER